MSVSSTAPAPTRVPMGSGAINLFRKGSGRTVVVLHAAGGAGAWNPYLERLSEHFDVIAPDHPGFGLSDELPEIGSVPQLVPHYVDLLEKLDVDRFDLVGASFGGWVAAELACSVPERIEHLVLMAPAGLHVPDAPPADLFTMSPPEIVRALFYDSAIADAALSVPPPPEAAQQAARDAKAFDRFARDPFLHNPELPGRLPRITASTLVLAAEVDSIIPRAHSDAYAAAIAGAELRVAAECGHALYQERPGYVADLVIDFLGGTAR
ncbi:alpha/beta fold hydrolase [Pseudonocardia alaniniphila]|uniref:Alpha/beta fold hydrolase n=1 Tax=Pseudonocardia alaniniphila TaxID=75291 RepID=A0ABS9TC08_9PSEU|nr:alpha/beta hydrolase [Pseudonocardia alaniniphila]MCH6166037.1 alpha/beta fold hydrolase [Pseudonocardia alaniniphila]